MIPFDVGIDFIVPEFSIVFGPNEVFATIMLVPKTAIYKNNSLILGKDNVRLSRKSCIIFPVTETVGKQEFSHCFFWLGILAMYSRHIVASRFNAFYIHIRQLPPSA
jgi:hypothetical protein